MYPWLKHPCPQPLRSAAIQQRPQVSRSGSTASPVIPASTQAHRDMFDGVSAPALPSSCFGQNVLHEMHLAVATHLYFFGTHQDGRSGQCSCSMFAGSQQQAPGKQNTEMDSVSGAFTLTGPHGDGSLGSASAPYYALLHTNTRLYSSLNRQQHTLHAHTHKVSSPGRQHTAKAKELG